MKIQTASFFNYQGPGRICIARYAPRSIPAGYRYYKPLAPRQEMLRWPYARYRETYFNEILAALDPHEVASHVTRLADGHPAVLMCWEDLRKPGKWCHRRMVAEWLGEALGIDVPERY